MKSRTIIPRQFLIIIIILALSSQACSISLIDFSEWFPTSVPNTPSPANPSTMPRAEVTFTVQLPEPLTPGESLGLSVVDEVTGLALNAVDYQMTPLDTTTSRPAARVFRIRNTAAALLLTTAAASHPSTSGSMDSRTLSR